MTSSHKERTGDDLVFPEFDDIKVSTKTFTATTNLNIHIDELYQTLPITPYVVGFRNSITVIIILDKPINFKVCRNGTFQMTGCKSHEHADKCVKYIWEYIKNFSNIYSFTRGNSLEAIFIPSMRNIDFSLGFIVDREKLNQYMCTQKEFHCLLETSFGYTGVNVKVPLTKDIKNMEVKKIIEKDNEWKEVWTTYKEYLDILSPKERETKLQSERHNTFLVFHSGKVIMSGLTADFMRDVYYYFLSIIRASFNKIEERLVHFNDSDENELSLDEELALLEI